MSNTNTSKGSKTPIIEIGPLEELGAEWDINQIKAEAIKQLFASNKLNKQQSEQVKNYINNQYKFTNKDILDVKNGTFGNRLINITTNTYNITRKLTPEEIKASEKLALEKLLLLLLYLKSLETPTYTPSTYQEALIQLGLQTGKIKKNDNITFNTLKDIASMPEAKKLSGWKGTKSYSDFWLQVRKDINKLIELTAAGIVSAPVLAYGAVLAAPIIGNALKYMVFHPIESFVLPEVVNKGTNKAMDAYEYVTGTNINPSTRNYIGLTSLFILPSGIASYGRRKFGSVIRSGAEQVLGNNTFSNAMKSYITDATSNGDFYTIGLNKAANTLRYGLTTGVGLGTALAENIALDGRSLSLVLEENGVNPYIAEPLGFAGETLLFHGVNLGAHNTINKAVRNFNSLTGGSLFSGEALMNAMEASPSEIFFGDGSKGDIIYSQLHLSSDKQIANPNIGNRKDSYTIAKPDAELYNTPEELAIGNHKNIGEEITNGSLKVVDKIVRGDKFNKQTIEGLIAQLISNNTTRFDEGQRQLILRTHDSEQLPSLKEMADSKNWETVAIDDNGIAHLVPLTENTKFDTVGARGDFVAMKLSNNKNVMFNAAGHLRTFIRNKETGEVFLISIDTSGAGSAADKSQNGKTGFMSDVSNSGNTPYMTVDIKKVNPNEVLGKLFENKVDADSFGKEFGMSLIKDTAIEWIGRKINKKKYEIKDIEKLNNKLDNFIKEPNRIFKDEGVESGKTNTESFNSKLKKFKEADNFERTRMLSPEVLSFIIDLAVSKNPSEIIKLLKYFKDLPEPILEYINNNILQYMNLLIGPTFMNIAAKNMADNLLTRYTNKNYSLGYSNEYRQYQRKRENDAKERKDKVLYMSDVLTSNLENVPQKYRKNTIVLNMISDNVPLAKNGKYKKSYSKRFKEISKEYPDWYNQLVESGKINPDLFKFGGLINK